MRAGCGMATLLLLVALTGGAAADGEAHVGPLVIVLDNGQGACEDPTGLCPFGSTGESVGDLRVDARQDITHLGVAVDRSFVNDALGFPLLPDGAVMLTPEDYSAPHPAFRLLIETVGERRGPGDLQAFGVAFTEKGYGLSYYGPGLHPNDTSVGEHGIWTVYGDPSSSVISRDEIRAYVDISETSVDERFDDVDGLSACERLESADCQDAVEATTDLARETAPDAAVGLRFDHAVVATDPDAIVAPGGGEDARAAPAAASSAPSGDVAAPRMSLASPPRAALTPHAASPGARTPAPGGENAPDAHHPPLSAAAVVIEPQRPPELAPIVAASVALAVAVMLAAFYSRVLRREDALFTESRSAILGALANGPKSIADIARELALDRTTVEYHARMLEKASRVVVRRVERRVVLCLPGVKDAERAIAPRAKDVLARLIAEQGGAVTRRRLEELATGMPLRTQNRALQDLRAAGLLERVEGPEEPVLRLRAPAPAPEPQGSSVAA